MSTVNYLTARSSNLAAFNTIQLNVSTLTGSTIQTTATANTSSIVVSTLATRAATYSTLTGSTITTSSIITPVIATATGFTTIGQNTSFPNRSIEIGSDSANSVYFDFHSSDSVYSDYSTRIQSIGGSTIGQGHMSLQASTINILGTSGVGIGTSTPGYKLDVLGDVNFGSNDATNGSRIRLLGTNACIQGGPSGSDLLHLVSGNGAKALSVAYSGSVGIGTTNPTGKCHIYGAGQSTGFSDVYSFNISSADSFNGNGATTVYSESINMKAGDLTWSSNTIRVYGSRIYIGGGYSINGAQNQGNIIMYTGNAERARISDNGIALPGLNHINFGWDQTKEVNAGKMGYQLFTTGALDIVGAGTGTRTVKIWDNLTVQSNIGIGTFSPSYKLHVYGSMCLDRGAATYSSTVGETTYAAGTWYTMFSPNSLTVSSGTYLITMFWQPSPGNIPWNLGTSFLFHNTVSNDNATSQLSGAAVPTSYHATNNAGDWQLFVRAQSAGSAYCGLQWKSNGALPNGSWTVWAHLISA